MKIAVIGAHGQLGTDLLEVLSQEHDVIGLNHADIEITEIDSVKNALSTIKPAIVLNTAAYHIVPEAEKFPAKAFQINGIGAMNLAKVCQDLDTRLVHYSTDYVFDGKKQKPYTEDDRPNPLSVYANTKLSGEYFALNYCDKSYVVRVSGIYGKVPCRAIGGNFVTTMIKLAKEKPDIVHFSQLTNSSGVSLDHILAAKQSSAKIVYTNHLAKRIDQWATRIPWI